MNLKKAYENGIARAGEQLKVAGPAPMNWGQIGSNLKNIGSQIGGRLSGLYNGQVDAMRRVGQGVRGAVMNPTTSASTRGFNRAMGGLSQLAPTAAVLGGGAYLMSRGGGDDPQNPNHPQQMMPPHQPW